MSNVAYFLFRATHILFVRVACAPRGMENRGMCWQCPTQSGTVYYSARYLKGCMYACISHECIMREYKYKYICNICTSRYLRLGGWLVLILFVTRWGILCLLWRSCSTLEVNIHHHLYINIYFRHSNTYWVYDEWIKLATRFTA